MPFYETLQLNDRNTGHKRRIEPSIHPIELPLYRNGNQRQLLLRDDDTAVIREVNIAQHICTEHAYFEQEAINQFGGVALWRGRYFSRVCVWQPE